MAKKGKGSVGTKKKKENADTATKKSKYQAPPES